MSAARIANFWRRLSLGIAVILLIIDTSTIVEGFVNSPKIITKDGNLIFEAGFNRNISFRLNGKSRININDEWDIMDLLFLMNNDKRPIGRKEEWTKSEQDDASLRQLAMDVSNLRLRAFGAEGLETRLQNLQNRTRNANALLRRYQSRLRLVETKVQSINTQLEVNHCERNPCENGGTCFNTFNDFICKCSNGFEGNKCDRDVNECALYEGTDIGCQNGAQCVNQFGTFSCICTPGWYGVHCTQRKGDCLQSSGWELCGHGACVNSNNDAFGYKCICDPGWITNGLTPSCTVDVDECNTATPCTTKCINLPGSFTCAPCPAGMTGNGVSCQDIDECATNNGGCSLSPRVNCINTYGSFHCAECPVGWIGDGRSCTRNNAAANGAAATGAGALSGVTSCAQTPNICSPLAICSEISNTVVCSCPVGMVGNGIGANGCIRGTAYNCNALPCLNGGTCIDVDANYTCICPTGFKAPICEPLASPCQPNPCLNGGRCRPTGGNQFMCQCAPGYRDRLCSSRFSRCGGMLLGASGRLQYPPEKTGYEHNAQCAWVIRTNESSVLNVTFNAFDLEDGTDCRFDWLQLNDGRTAASQFIGRFCGRHKPHGGNIISSTNELYLWFRSDNATSKEGFDLTWNSIPPQCGGIIELKTHGTIATPGSPGNYPKNRDCRWLLRAANNKRIKLTFFSLQIETHESCNYDYVEIIDKVSGKELHKFCNSTHPVPLLLATNEAEVHFHSDNEGTDTGFQIHYATEERVPGCGGTYTAERGTINSPLRATEQEISCEYDIRMAIGESISIDFEEYKLDADDCLEIYNVDVARDIHVLDSKHCGAYAELPVRFNSLYNAVQLRFYANSGSSSFRLNYHAECSYTYESSTGTILSPGYPAKISNIERFCTYKILTEPGTVIAVNTIDFQLLDSSLLDGDDCATTFLRINDGLDRNILGPFCGNSTPDVDLVSQTNMLQFHFQSGSTSSGRGFKFSYKSVATEHTDCGGVYTKPGGTIRLPTDNNGMYQNDLTCYWVIMAPNNKGIILNWKSMKLETSSDCTYDYIEIYDNLANSDDDKPLGRYCDSRPPPNMMTHSRLLTLKFVSDFGDTDEGFELTYDFVSLDDCGGHIHATTGRITSPGFPQNYTGGADCHWIITGPIDTQIELRIELFDLEKTLKCGGDWLEIRNGGNKNSSLIGRYCGDSIPRRIPSFTNQLSIEFHTDSFVSGRGFRIGWYVYSNGCGGILKGENGLITSPFYPNLYPSNAACEWHVLVHKGSSIHFIIEDIEMEDIFNCYYDHLEIFDGNRAHMLPLIRTCDMESAKSLQVDTTNSEATIIFQSDSSSNGRGFRMSFETNCTRVLTNMEGIVESINYGEFNYDHQINCSWTIRAPKSNRVLLEFSHFEYLAAELEERRNHALYLIEKLPDNKIRTQRITETISFNSTDNELTIVHNTSVISFRLEYKMDGCLFVEHRDSGHIQTPNYPKMYANNLECLWEIRTDLGKGIELTIEDLDIEESVNCTNDALIISNDLIVPPANMSYMNRHCGAQKSLVLTSSSHRLFVRFVSNAAHNGKGFSANYRVVPSVCGGKMNLKNGIIQSPNYPRPYPMSANCEWSIEVTQHHGIIFEFEDLDIESGFVCNWDYVEAMDIYDEDENRLFKLCGADIDPARNWRTTSNTAVVRFVSDDSNQMRGFKLHFRETCGERVSVTELTFYNFDFKRYARINETCTWTLVPADAEKHIIFTPTHVLLHPAVSSVAINEGACIEHGVKIYDGDYSSGAPRSKFCKTLPPAIISKSHALTITIDTNNIMELQGDYMIMDTVCGSVYDSFSGRFASPYYPDSYPVNIDCEWVIEARPGNSISLTFESMDLENSDECNSDYVEVREMSESGPLLGVFCGNTVPPAMVGKESLWLKFKSNDDVVGEGFMVSYNYEKHNEINGTNGTIQSPHYPSKFQTNEPYSWRITVDKGFVVLLSIKHIIDINIPHIKFYDGYSDIGALIDYRETHVVRSNTNYLYFTAPCGPFEFEWERLSKEALRSNRTAEEQSKLCGKQVFTIYNTTVFSSPGYPSGYAPNLECSWMFVPANPAMHAVLSFSKIDLEQVADCLTDYVRVSESYDLQTWQQLDKLCSKPNTTRYYHGKPYLKLDFNSDPSINQTGFSSYVRTECGSKMTAQRGLVNITNLRTASSMFQMDCVWTIQVRQGRRIRIKFPDSLIHDPNDLSNANNCNSFFMVRNGFDNDSPFLGRGKYCENNITDTLETTANRAYIRFKRFGFTRFRASFSYEELNHDCSDDIILTEDTYDGDSTIINTPNYPNLPNPHSECFWRITAPMHHVISLNFIDDFSLAPGTAPITDVCDREYVQINDGNTELMPLIGRYCGKNKPNAIYSTGNVMRIKYFSDEAEPQLGFKAQVRIGRCGGSYYSSEGTISSPEKLVIRSDEVDFECVYTIEVEKGSTINLNFERVQLTQSNNCSEGAHLELEEIDSYNENGEEKITDTLLLCGSEPMKYIVETNKIVIRYKLRGRSPQNGDGFSLQYNAIGARCGETIEAYRGVLLSPGYPGGTRTPMHCTWRIKVPTGRNVKVEILDFDTGANTNSIGTLRSFRGRLSFANDFSMKSIIGRYSSNPPAEVISTDNTMAIDAFLLPFSRHRGFKLRFSAFQESKCHSQMDMATLSEGGSLHIKRENNSLIYCNIDLQVDENETLALDIVKHVSHMPLMNNPHVCSSNKPMNVHLSSVQLLPRLLCQNESLPITVRLPFTTQLELSGSKRNDLEEIQIDYKLYKCGGIRRFYMGENMTITAPQMTDSYIGKRLECAWGVWPLGYGDDNTDDLNYWIDGVQIELSLAVDFKGNCSDQYLLLYNGPNQNSPHLGRYCNQATLSNVVVERGIFFEYHTTSHETTSNFNLTVKHGSGCGGKITYPYRDIFFDEQYKNNVECVWEIETDPGFHISLSFNDRFFIESSTNCTKDYLKVQQKSATSDAWIDLGTICGREPPKLISTNTTAMRLIFRSNDKITGDGFTAHFERQCGGIFYATNDPAIISSPGYPLNYEKNLFCNYTILPLDANSVGLLVRFLDFDIEQPPIMNKCTFDNVTIVTTNLQNEKHESIICGVRKMHEYRAKSAISVVMRTDMSYAGRGFQLEYTTNVCGGIITKSTIIESPRQHTDNKFPPNSNCYWNLRAPIGNKIIIKFEQINFENQPMCNYDAVEIYKGPAPLEYERIGLFCGNLTGSLPILSIPTHQALIHSFSDERDASFGFKAVVRFLPNCDRNIYLEATNATYNFNEYAGSYADNLDCSFVFTTTPDRQLQLEFSSFHIEASTDCSSDFLEVRDGAGPFADQIGKFCGHDIPVKLMSARNAVFLRFVSDKTIHDTGFALVVTATPVVCGNHNIKLDNQTAIVTFNSPADEDGNYSNNLNCYWRIIGKSKLHLKFKHFEMQNSSVNGTCNTDYLKMYNMEDAALIEKGYHSNFIFNGQMAGLDYMNYATEHIYCGSGIPDDYYANSNEVYVKFHTDSSVTKKGFSIEIKQTQGCFRNFTGLQGRIKVADTTDHCDIYIKAPVNYTLSIYYADLTFSDYDCDSEYVEAFDLHTNKSLQHICSYMEPGKSLFSNTNEIRLRIKMNGFYSDYDMTYLASKNGIGCGGDLYNTAGIITNAYYPNNVRNNSDCRWNIRVPGNNLVLLRFDEFNLGARSTCHSDYLQIIEHNDSSGKDVVVRQFCGDDRPRIYKSNRSQLTVRFHKTMNYDGTGWVIRFYGVYSNYQIPSYMLDGSYS